LVNNNGISKIDAAATGLRNELKRAIATVGRPIPVTPSPASTKIAPISAVDVSTAGLIEDARRCQLAEITALPVGGMKQIQSRHNCSATIWVRRRIQIAALHTIY
jgi:hypothetical protein